VSSARAPLSPFFSIRMETVKESLSKEGLGNARSEEGGEFCFWLVD